MCNILQQLANATSLSIYALTPTSYISRSGEKCPLVHEYLEPSFQSVKSCCSRLLKAMSELLNCPMCSYIASHEKQLLRHVCQIHEHDPNFLIYCSKCSRSFTKLESFQKYKLRSSQCLCSNVTFRKTPTSPGPSDDMSTTNYDSEESLASSVVPRGLSMKWRAAMYIMEIKEKHLLSQAAVDTVISSTTSLVNGLLQGVLTELREELPE